MELRTRYAYKFQPGDLPSKARAMLHQASRALELLAEGVQPNIKTAMNKRHDDVNVRCCVEQIEAANRQLDPSICFAGSHR